MSSAAAADELILAFNRGVRAGLELALAKSGRVRCQGVVRSSDRLLDYERCALAFGHLGDHVGPSGAESR